VIGKGLRELHRGVAAAAIGDDHLGAAGAERPERLQCTGNDRGLVEDRDDDGESPHCAMMLQGCDVAAMKLKCV